VKRDLTRVTKESSRATKSNGRPESEKGSSALLNSPTGRPDRRPGGSNPSKGPSDQPDEEAKIGPDFELISEESAHGGGPVLHHQKRDPGQGFALYRRKKNKWEKRVRADHSRGGD